MTKPITEQEIKAVQDLTDFAKRACRAKMVDPVTAALLQDCIKSAQRLTDKLIDNGYVTLPRAGDEIAKGEVP
jgi:hypothetical protein